MIEDNAEKTKAEILESVVVHYLNSAIHDFETGYNHSADPPTLIRLEKERVTRILNDEDFNNRSQFYYWHDYGEIADFNSSIIFGVPQYNTYRQIDSIGRAGTWHNKIAFWHKEFVRAKYDLSNDAGPEWIEKRPALNAPIAALVYHRYLRYLEKKEQDINEPKDNMADTFEEAMTYKDTNPKKYFMSRVYLSAKFTIEDAQKRVEKEIEAQKSRSAPGVFLKWLEQQNEELINEPALKMLDHIPNITSSPENFTSYLTKNIDTFVPTPIDWNYHWEMAGKILMGLEDTSEIWEPYGLWVRSYCNGVKADAKAKVFARYLEKTTQPDEVESQKESVTLIALMPEFIALFVHKEAAYKAIEAAITVGIIDKNGKWKHGKRGDKVLVIRFWVAVSNPKYALTYVVAMKGEDRRTMIPQCKVIALQFGVPGGIGETTIKGYDWKRENLTLAAIMRHLEADNRP